MTVPENFVGVPGPSKQDTAYGGPNNPYVYALDINYAFWLDGKEYQTDELSADGASVLRSTANVWQQRTCGPSEACLSSLTGGAYNSNGSLSPTDPRLTSATVTLEDTNQVSEQTYSYDQYNNRTDLYEYDYGSGSRGALIRHRQTSYITNGYDTLTGTHFPSLVAEDTVYVGSGTQVADTQYCYDAQTGTNCRAAVALTARSNLSGYTDPGNSQRGNLATTARWVSTTSTYIQTSAAYDNAGSVVSTKDGRGNTTSYNFSDNFSTGTTLNSTIVEYWPTAIACYPNCASFALPTKVTNPLSQSVSTEYDYYLGKPTGTTDLYTGSMTSYTTTVTYSGDGGRAGFHAAGDGWERCAASLLRLFAVRPGDPGGDRWAAEQLLHSGYAGHEGPLPASCST